MKLNNCHDIIEFVLDKCANMYNTYDISKNDIKLVISVNFNLRYVVMLNRLLRENTDKRLTTLVIYNNNGVVVLDDTVQELTDLRTLKIYQREVEVDGRVTLPRNIRELTIRSENEPLFANIRRKYGSVRDILSHYSIS